MKKKTETPPEVANEATQAAPDVPATETPSTAPDAAPTKPEATESDKDKYRKTVETANRRLHKFQAAVSEAEAELDIKKGVLKKAIGNRDAAVCDLQKAIEGQRSLPGLEEAGYSPPDAPQPGNPDNWPISELGAKQLAKTVGKDLVAACKERGEPIGLTNKTLETLEGADIRTIADLEKQMREAFAWWSPLAKTADAIVVRRVSDSLREFRVVNRHAEVTTATAVDTLAPVPQTILDAAGVTGASA